MSETHSVPDEHLAATELMPIQAGIVAARESSMSATAANNALHAARLITMPALAAGLRWSRHPHELAEHLWVDQPTLRTRMATLDPVKVADLEHQLDGD